LLSASFLSSLQAHCLDMAPCRDALPDAGGKGRETGKGAREGCGSVQARYGRKRYR
jgi:hypothetical protein